jgi:hypothetical protein
MKTKLIMVLVIVCGGLLLFSIIGYQWSTNAYSKLIVRLQKRDAEFWRAQSEFSKGDNKMLSLINTLDTYRSNIISGKWNVLYDMRTDAYKSSVSRERFLSQVVKHQVPPSGIYFTLEGGKTTPAVASFKATYVCMERAGVSCTESEDIWKWDSKADKWQFVSNSLPWGSPLVSQ